MGSNLSIYLSIFDFAACRDTSDAIQRRTQRNVEAG